MKINFFTTVSTDDKLKIKIKTQGKISSFFVSTLGVTTDSQLKEIMDSARIEILNTYKELGTEADNERIISTLVNNNPLFLQA